MYLGKIAAGALALVMLASAASAAECEASHDPSPETNIPTGVNFYNNTSYATRIYWIGFDGFLNEYALIQPGESAKFDSYVHHKWLVEVYAPERTECLGPISAPDQETCEARILWNDGVGIDAGYCDF